MPVNAAAENAFGTLGTICWSIQIIPQIWKSWRDKSTEGLSPWLVFTWGVAGGPLGVYAIVQNLNIPLILQPQLFCVLCLISWGQCQFYGNKRSLRTSVAMTVGVVILTGVFEVAMVFAIRPTYPDSPSASRAVQFFGIFTAILISGALFPQYYEIYKRKEVVGVSMLFMLVDLSGGVFSDLSLVFKEKFDIIASITYSMVVLLDGLVILAAIILNPRARRRRSQEPSLESASQTNTITGLDTPTLMSAVVTRVGTPSLPPAAEGTEEKGQLKQVPTEN